MRLRLSVFILMLTIFASGIVAVRVLQAQVQIPTSTPAPVRLSSPTPPEPEGEVNPEDDGSFNNGLEGEFDISNETAVPRDLIMIEPQTDVAVYSSPEVIDENQIGTIGPGDRYNVLGRYFNWIQFQYDAAPDQRGWVYQDLVQIEGNADAIPTVILNPTATSDPEIEGATQTIDSILSEPDGELTVTALARVIQLPGEANTGEEGDNGNRQINPDITARPTFTYPPNVAAAAPTLEVTRAINIALPAENTDRAIAPIIPILLLSGLGLLGLVISVLRSI